MTLSEEALQQFRLRLIGVSGEIRHAQYLQSNGGSDLWRATSIVADRFGRAGEFLQVFDERGDMVIRVGVSTARNSSPDVSAAA